MGQVLRSQIPIILISGSVDRKISENEGILNMISQQVKEEPYFLFRIRSDGSIQEFDRELTKSEFSRFMYFFNNNDSLGSYFSVLSKDFSTEEKVLIKNSILNYLNPKRVIYKNVRKLVS